VGLIAERRPFGSRDGGGHDVTEKLFWDDPYLTTLDTVVTGIGGDLVTLASTIFFAESGGQESDEGTIGGRPVIEARSEGTAIRYLLPGGHGLSVGDPVRVEIDGKRRLKLMRLHFAAELVLVLVHRAVPGIEKVGAHIAANKARIDFAYSENISELFLPILTEIAHLVAADSEIVSAFEDAAAERRYWEVPGLARVACGGTHPRHVGEVGAIVLNRKNPGRGVERIEIRLA
jgi:Ser-tRNA(Ala) deacylase AlaX